ncbi:cytochrome D1 domain-containing protein [Fusibacter sp. 3D3]|uniref:WD40 domain-containing protein n=1 Tax=Fusibacter sp. 3D3 TaxID=1048380 RepID=UPI000852ACB1|nr:cytochrome D1 domain-containing protein [Fusibacter sp. 3D3]GAU75618.1 high-affnity carbon uptake protein Hat/HatR [Fusibacter sp. 3D3]
MKTENSERNIMYDAFISYRHIEPDVSVASALYLMFEAFKVPKEYRNADGAQKLNVFLDQEVLACAPVLTEAIRENIRKSRYLIVICSKRTPLSDYVIDEIEAFIRFHGPEKIIPLQVEGEPSESFLKPHMGANNINVSSEMQKFFTNEYLAADIRPASVKSSDFKGYEVIEKAKNDVLKQLKKETIIKLKEEKYKIFASILGCNRNDLRQRQREKLIKLIVMAMLGVTVLGVSFGGYAYKKNLKLNKTNMELNNANMELSNTILELSNAYKALEIQKKDTEDERERANINAEDAINQKNIANANAVEAEMQKEVANTNALKAKQQLAFSTLGLAKLEIKNGDRIKASLLTLEALKNLDKTMFEYNLLATKAEAILNAAFVRNIGDMVTTLNSTSDIENIVVKKNNIISTLSVDGNVIDWDVQSGKKINETGRQNHIGSRKSPSNGAMASDGKISVLRTDVGDLVVVDNVNDEIKHELIGHTAYVNRIVISPNKKYIATSSYDDSVIIWDMSSGALLEQLQKRSRNILDLNISPNSKKMVISFEDGAVEVWDIESRNIVKVLKSHTSAVNSVCFSSDGKYIITGSKDKTAKVWDVESGELLKTIEDVYSVNCAIISNNNKYLILGSYEGSVSIFDMASERLIVKKDIDLGSKIRITSSSEGQYIVAWAEDSSKAYVFDVVGSIEKYTEQNLYYGTSSLAINANRNEYYVGLRDKKLRICNLSDGMLLRSIDDIGSIIYSISVSQNGDYFVTGQSDGSVGIYDSKTLTLLKRLEGHKGEVYCTTISSDAKMIVSGGKGSIILHNIETGVIMGRLDYLGGQVKSVAITQDTKFIGMGLSDGNIIIWNTVNGDKIKLSGHFSAVSAIEFSPDEKRLITGSYDEQVIIWEVPSYKILKEIRDPIDGDAVNNVVYSHDGRKIIVAYRNGNIIGMDSDNYEKLMVLKSTSSNALTAISDDGTEIVAGYADGGTIIWPCLTLNELISTANSQLNGRTLTSDDF